MIAISCETWRKNDKVNHERIANENSGRYILSCGNNTFIFESYIYLFLISIFSFNLNRSIISCES